jgi:hypothetical protein
MHQAPHHPRPHPRGHKRPQEHGEQQKPGLLSQSDPEPERSTWRPPVWLIIIGVLLVAFVVLHLAGGPHP